MNFLDSKILKDSSAYELLQEIIRLNDTRLLLIELATDRLGDLTEAQQTRLEGIRDREQLVRLCKKIGTVSTWDELLASEVSS